MNDAASDEMIGYSEVEPQNMMDDWNSPSSAAAALSAAALSLAESGKKGEYLSIEDMQAKTKVTKAVIETLKEVGVLHGLPESSQLSLF